jgi:3-hydroxyisobutyrate dehydrogenase-like beta-hydroxyacid dehydrogenase
MRFITTGNMAVGVVGTGKMGSQMALNLLKAGFPVIAHNRSPEPVERLVEALVPPTAARTRAWQNGLTSSAA